MKYLALALVLIGSAAAAQPVDDLEGDDSLALTIAWRLQAANAPYCARVAPATGIQLEDTALFNDPAGARARYGLGSDLYIGALAAEGPGARAGLAVNAGVTAIDGQRLTLAPGKSGFDRLNHAQALLDDTAARVGSVQVSLADGRTLRIASVPVCHVSITVDDGKSYARASRDAIHLGRPWIEATRGKTDLVAALIAHEMAHAVLDHQALLAASHGAIGVTRRTEREADRLSVWLLANAGYPPEAAVTLQRTVVARHYAFLAIDLTHDSWQTRARIISEEIATLKSAPDADWAHRFQREIMPNP